MTRRATGERGAAPDHDFKLVWKPRIHGEPAAALFHEHKGAGHHVLLMIMPPQEKVKISILREVVFVIDTPGSMEGESIRQARAALPQDLGSLKPSDRFTVIQFNSIFDCLLITDAAPTLSLHTCYPLTPSPLAVRCAT